MTKEQYEKTLKEGLAAELSRKKEVEEAANAAKKV
jgi:hypothetical protein